MKVWQTGKRTLRTAQTKHYFYAAKRNPALTQKQDAKKLNFGAKISARTHVPRSGGAKREAFFGSSSRKSPKVLAVIFLETAVLLTKFSGFRHLDQTSSKSIEKQVPINDLDVSPSNRTFIITPKWGLQSQKRPKSLHSTERSNFVITNPPPNKKMTCEDAYLYRHQRAWPVKMPIVTGMSGTKHIGPSRKTLFWQCLPTETQIQTETCRKQKEEPRKHICDRISLRLQKWKHYFYSVLGCTQTKKTRLSGPPKQDKMKATKHLFL